MHKRTAAKGCFGLRTKVRWQCFQICAEESSRVLIEKDRKVQFGLNSAAGMRRVRAELMLLVLHVAGFSARSFGCMRTRGERDSCLRARGRIYLSVWLGGVRTSASSAKGAPRAKHYKDRPLPPSSFKRSPPPHTAHTAPTVTTHTRTRQ